MARALVTTSGARSITHRMAALITATVFAAIHIATTGAFISFSEKSLLLFHKILRWCFFSFSGADNNKLSTRLIIQGHAAESLVVGVTRLELKRINKIVRRRFQSNKTLFISPTEDYKA
uniref:Uncharacterized protein n=1 Tax=Cryptomonas curvata TaxID=233186 RepID=A0A7S0M6B0_9CRYP|mmetsp:Transcript_2648/g.5629  ORF Transcript_2648/g.5629 Transcript_2648/m.5629 type:complete len:119 (+) Transcript_2648:267-623(+)